MEKASVKDSKNFADALGAPPDAQGVLCYELSIDDKRRIELVTFRFDDPSVIRRVLGDLEQLEAGNLDMAGILATAPLLEKYKLVLGWSHAMKGIVTGHPLLPDGKEIVTSQLMYLDPSIGLARTLSRWYRIGAPCQQRGN